jgi:hypothetical protein
LRIVVGIGDVSLIGVVFDGVVVDRIAWSISTDEPGDLALDGVLDVLIDGDCSILSNCSRNEATPLLIGLGDRGVGDWSRIMVDGDCARGCKTGVCWDVFGIVPLDGVLVVVDEVRLEGRFVDGEDGKGSDFVNWGGETFPPDT